MHFLSNLARLLAIERLWVRHKNVSTASFDTVARILTLPNWQNVSESVYTMLTGHEVSHAKHTPRQPLWELAAKIDPQNLPVAGAYLNITEDARIERLIQTQFPGLRADFSAAYAELFEKFGIAAAAQSDPCFIDRINLHFKFGVHLRLTFTPAEQVLVDKVNSTMTWDDVMAVTKEIYQYAKREPPRNVCEIVVESDDAGGVSGETGETGQDPSVNASGAVSASVEASGSDHGHPAIPVTQASLDRRLENLMDRTTQIVYVRPPTPNLDNIVKDHTSIHQAIRSHFSDSHMTAAEASFLEFQKLNLRKINYIVQQFEMRKQADRYQRTRIHKTGALDILRLHEYKYADDLFRSVSIAARGKNHGLVFVIDWSGSMQSIMPATLQQLMILCLFCRKVHIPFEVYALTTQGKSAFKKEPETFQFYNNLSMINYLSSRMTQSEFFEACVNLYALMPGGKWSNPKMPAMINLCGCTPLDEAVTAATRLIHGFRIENKIQIVNAVFLTDGDANTVSGYFDDTNVHRHLDWKTKYILEDAVTHRNYEFRARSLTPTLLRLMRDRENIHVVGFYVGGSSSFRNFFPAADEKTIMTLEGRLKTDGYLISSEWGYDELYITDMQAPVDHQIHATTAAETTDESFFQERAANTKERIMLTSFVKMIA